MTEGAQRDTLVPAPANLKACNVPSFIMQYHLCYATGEAILVAQKAEFDRQIKKTGHVVIASWPPIVVATMLQHTFEKARC